MRRPVVALGIVKNFVTVLNHELHGVVLGVHVSHLTLKTCVSHDSGCKDYGKILGCHL